MIKTFFLIAVGLIIGYYYGFNDAQEHTDNLGVRIVNEIGGKSRASVKTDADSKLDSLEHH